jgi:hypothetical protein
MAGFFAALRMTNEPYAKGSLIAGVTVAGVKLAGKLPKIIFDGNFYRESMTL